MGLCSVAAHDYNQVGVSDANPVGSLLTMVRNLIILATKTMPAANAEN
jgi:hypothetical protein